MGGRHGFSKEVEKRKRTKLYLLSWFQADQTAAKQESFESSITASIQNLLNNFKEEVIRSVMTIHNTGKHTNEPPPPNFHTPNKAQDDGGNVHSARDMNDLIIDNVMRNLSQYSTPPRSASDCPGSDGRTVHTSSRLPFVLHNEDPALDDATISATSHTKEATKEAAPSFSLGLTQELNPPPPGWGVMICLTSPPTMVMKKSETAHLTLCYAAKASGLRLSLLVLLKTTNVGLPYLPVLVMPSLLSVFTPTMRWLCPSFPNL
ncbi:hypothetical protein Bca4012_083764 [Brassica carinata]